MACKDENLDTIKVIVEKNGLESIDNITRFEGGPTGGVYDLHNGLVVKLEDNRYLSRGLFDHQAEYVEKLKKLGAKVPKIFDVGMVGERGYMLLERIEGNVWEADWKKFDMNQKEHLIEGLVEQLRIFHSLKAEKYMIPMCDKLEFVDWKSAIKYRVNFEKVSKQKEKGILFEEISFLESFFLEKLKNFDLSEKPVFIHHDIQFGNVFHLKGHLSGIIDFDWACLAPREYELWKIVAFAMRPWDYIKHSLRGDYQKSLVQEIQLIKKYYSELFINKNVCDNIRVYYLFNLIHFISLLGTENGENEHRKIMDIKEKIKIMYRSNWLEYLFFDKTLKA